MLTAEALKLAQQINKNFSGIKPIITEPHLDITPLPTGSIFLDKIIGINGYPLGRVVEIFGAESSGKSTLALSACKYDQIAGNIPVYIDVEYSLDMQYARQIGVDTDKILIAQPGFAENVFETAEYAVLNGAKLVILDSVGNLISKRETQEESDMSDTQIGRNAFLLSKFLRRIVPILHKENALLIILNQMRSKIGTMPGMPTDTTPGGKALLHNGSVRLRITRIGKDTDDDPKFIRSKIVAVKNKVAAPLQECEIRINFGEGIDIYYELINILIDNGIIKKGGAWFSYKDMKWQGLQSVSSAMKESKDLKNELLSLLQISNKEVYFK